MTSAVKGRTFERESYSAEDIERLLALVESGSPTSVRNHALIVVLWQSGLRISEALDLRPADVDAARRDIFVRHGKGDKARHVAVSQEVISEVLKWSGVRASLEPPAEAPLFCTLRGGRLHATYVRDMLHRLAVRAGWEKRIHPHGFRHTYAVSLARAGVSPAFIQRQLGHSSIRTTEIYLSSIGADDIAQAIAEVDFHQ